MTDYERWVGPETEPKRRARAFYLIRPKAQAQIKPNLFSKFFKPKVWSLSPTQAWKIQARTPLVHHKVTKD
jgi:hypothetical protein